LSRLLRLLQRVSASDIANLQIQPLAHWHGSLYVKIVGWTIKYLDPHPIGVTTFDFQFPVQAVADLPVLGVPGDTLQLFENLAQTLTDLSATLVDTVTDNGEEVLAIIISGVPVDSFFSVGSNTGEGNGQSPLVVWPILSTHLHLISPVLSK
jgi:hypothetical protein